MGVCVLLMISAKEQADLTLYLRRLFFCSCLSFFMQNVDFYDFFKQKRIYLGFSKHFYVHVYMSNWGEEGGTNPFESVQRPCGMIAPDI